MAKSDLVDLIYNTIAHETPRAWLIEFDPDKEPIWIPKDQCEVDEDAKTVTMKAWLAEKKEIEDYVK